MFQLPHADISPPSPEGSPEGGGAGSMAYPPPPKLREDFVTDGPAGEVMSFLSWEEDK